VPESDTACWRHRVKTTSAGRSARGRAAGTTEIVQRKQVTSMAPLRKRGTETVEVGNSGARRVRLSSKPKCELRPEARTLAIGQQQCAWELYSGLQAAKENPPRNSSLENLCSTEASPIHRRSNLPRCTQPSNHAGSVRGVIIVERRIGLGFLDTLNRPLLADQQRKVKTRLANIASLLHGKGRVFVEAQKALALTAGKDQTPFAFPPHSPKNSNQGETR